MTENGTEQPENGNKTNKSHIQQDNQDSSSKRNKKVDVWSRFKDIMELVLIAAGVSIGLFTLCSIEDQVETAIKHTEAVWYATRPVLTVKSINYKNDIIPYTKPVNTPSGPITDSMLFHQLNITIQNIGPSPAALDTIYYELIGNGQLGSGFNDLSTTVSPDQQIIDKVPTILRTDAQNYLRIHFHYYWEQREATIHPLSFQREYGFAFNNNSWKVGLYSSDKFDSLLNNAIPVDTSE